jgi:hypothetical protein
VECVTGCEADYDGELISFDEGKDILEKSGIEAIIYTSPSHLPDKPRWRILCRFSERLQPERRAQMVARLNGLFHGTLDAASFTLSQSHYYGHVVDADGNPVAHKKNGAGIIEILPTEYRVEPIKGQPLNQCDELDRGAIGKSGRAKSDDSGVLYRRLHRAGGAGPPHRFRRKLTPIGRFDRREICKKTLAHRSVHRIRRRRLYDG